MIKKLLLLTLLLMCFCYPYTGRAAPMIIINGTSFDVYQNQSFANSVISNLKATSIDTFTDNVLRKTYAIDSSDIINDIHQNPYEYEYLYLRFQILPENSNYSIHDITFKAANSDKTDIWVSASSLGINSQYPIRMDNDGEIIEDALVCVAKLTDNRGQLIKRIMSTTIEYTVSYEKDGVFLEYSGVINNDCISFFNKADTKGVYVEMDTLKELSLHSHEGVDFIFDGGYYVRFEKSLWTNISDETLIRIIENPTDYKFFLLSGRVKNETSYTMYRLRNELATQSEENIWLQRVFNNGVTREIVNIENNAQCEYEVIAVVDMANRDNSLVVEVLNNVDVFVSYFTEGFGDVVGIDGGSAAFGPSFLAKVDLIGIGVDD